MPSIAPRPWRIVLLFLLAFGLLQALWSASRGGPVERFVIHQLTVVPAAMTINLLTPSVQARPVEASIRAEGGGLNIRNGCEGTEVLFLLVAVFTAASMSWRRRLFGLATGVLMVYALNQARILLLFYAYRGHRAWFDALHTLVLPAILVVATAAFCYAFVHVTQRPVA